MVSEEKVREIIIKDVYNRIDAMGYGIKHNGFGGVSYSVKGKQMTLAGYQEYCIKQEFSGGIKLWQIMLLLDILGNLTKIVKRNHKNAKLTWKRLN